MFILYIMALLPIVIGFILWRISYKIHIIEWLISTVIAIITVILFHFIAIAGMTADVETWSGKIVKAVYHPKWIEKYTEDVYKTETYTDSKGQTHSKRVFSHTETHYRTHEKHWEAIADYGISNETYSITEQFYNDIKNKFGNNQISEYKSKSGFYSGDHNIYYVNNQTGYIYPTNATYHFENKIKACPTVFSFIKIPESMKEIYDYPKNKNWQVSGRLLGSAKNKINIFDWDVLNAKLGETKKVNLILIGFDSADSMLGQYQEAKFIGGKKNDLVITYGEVNGKIAWTYVFGWTENSIVKRNLETILLENKINSDIIKLIEKEVYLNYQKKDWKKFDYLTVEPPVWSYIILVFIMIISQGICYVVSFKNNINKGE